MKLPWAVQEDEKDLIRLRLDESSGTIGLFVRGFALCQESVNKFLKKLANTKEFKEKVAPRVNEICFFRLCCLDNWEPLLETLQKSGTNIEALYFEDCKLSKQGAILLGNVLRTNAEQLPPNTSMRGFCIKEMEIRKLCGSTEWIDGLLENKTITKLKFSKTPALFGTIQFILKSPQLKHADICDLQKEEGDQFNFDVNTLNQDVKSSMDLKKLEIKFRDEEQIPLNLCEGIRRILKQAKNLDELSLGRDKSGLPDLLRGAIHCREVFIDDYDPHTISFLVHGDGNGVAGKLKSLNLCDVKDASKFQQLLQLINLSVLDSFHISHYGSDPSTINRLIDDVCHQLDENKGGPKELSIYMEEGIMSEFASRLASALVGNDKIEQLRIHALEIGDDLGPQKELMDAISTMPRLSEWEILSYEDRIAKRILRKWQEWTLHHVQSDENIQVIYAPFDDLGDEIKDVLNFNKHWRKLFRHHDQMSSGIWSPALSRIETVDIMFRVVREVPNLFQQVANASSERDPYRFPSFAVPHHPNCPGCHKKRRTQASART